MRVNKILASGKLPDWLFRTAIRSILRKKIRKEPNSPEMRIQLLNKFIEVLKQQPIALHTQDANEQHYELPTKYFQTILGPYLKYSACFWPSSIDCSTKELSHYLPQAEETMLKLCCERADLHPGQSILELGSGWGSMTLYIAEKYPEIQITAMSNSATQQEYIQQQAHQRGLTNINSIKANIQNFHPPQQYDRVISIEMFEHMRNYPSLFTQVFNYLKPHGKLFIHIFAYHYLPYLFEAGKDQDWMARHFFAGGTMPSYDLFLHCVRAGYLEKMWIVNGTHYGKTLRAWLQKMDHHQLQLIPLFKECYGDQEYFKWWHYWRAFFIICEELFKFDKGKHWFVSHYLFQKF
jgi:cyclopropane-fatty-acyl-phospholipid synthase